MSNMATDITELAQRNELLIANGQQTADLLRHLADNEIDSDYFAVASECESYGKETEAELSITEFALRAARYVDELVEALEKAQQRIAELEEAEQKLCAANVTLDARAELAERQLQSSTVRLPKEHSATEFLFPVAVYSAQELTAALAAQGIKVEAE